MNATVATKKNLNLGSPFAPSYADVKNHYIQCHIKYIEDKKDWKHAQKWFSSVKYTWKTFKSNNGGRKLNWFKSEYLQDQMDYIESQQVWLNAQP